ncbi:hypothetical protein AWN76_004470 [Rhodothermaceae bacterium RA]|nr:hypothetical protein AWN76_004470 [Rhodothermaceae bacterium RA]
MRVPSGLLLCLPAMLLLAACDDEPDPQAIVDRAIAVHGGEVLAHAEVTFDFRGRRYRAWRQGGRFSYERWMTDSLGTDTLHQVHDVLTNDGLYREVDGLRVPLTEEEAAAVESGVNSVIYFALLPFPLNDPAVRKRYLGPSTIGGEPYHEVEVTFRPEGGGRDYEDRFVYWFHRRHGTMDYLAYDFHVNGGGTRFRQAVNVRTVGGVRFADYLNYTSPALPGPGTPIERYDTLMEADSLEPVSEIRLEHIEVRPLTP